MLVSNIKLLVEKYQKWNNKFLASQTTEALSPLSTTTPTTTTTTTSVRIAISINVNKNNLVSDSDSTIDSEPTNKAPAKSSKSASQHRLNPPSPEVMSSIMLSSPPSPPSPPRLKNSLIDDSPSKVLSSLSSALSSNISSASPTAASSGYFPHSQGDRCSDTKLLAAAATQTIPNLYDYLRNFLKRKLFHQTTTEAYPMRTEAEDDASHEGIESKEGENHGYDNNKEEGEKEKRNSHHLDVSGDEDATSDYSEDEVLDSSYNADEEYETDTDTIYTYPDTDEEYFSNFKSDKLPHSPPPSQLSPPILIHSQTATLVHNSLSNSTPSNSSEDEEEDSDDNDGFDDARISYCCQPLSDNKCPKRGSRPKAKVRTKQQRQQQQKTKQQAQNLNASKCQNCDRELLNYPWYQPQLSSKSAASILLQHAVPGTFVIRRTSRHFELTLRLEPSSSEKVKHYTVLAYGDCGYKFRDGKKQFSSLKALVIHHSVIAEDLPLTLVLPRPICKMQKQQQWRSHLRDNHHQPWPQQQQQKLSLRLSAYDFDAYESLQISGLLKYLKEENWKFS